MIKRLPIIASLMVMALVVSVAQVSADSEITDNGAGSNNYIKTVSDHTSTSTQSNYANTNTDVSVSLNSGGNTVSGNTGGDNSVMTGGTHADVLVVNDINKNYMTSSGCCPSIGNGDSLIANNGAKSRNTILSKTSVLDVMAQANKANTSTKIKVDASSGDNKVEKNTGGDNEVETGHVGVEVGVVNDINLNEMESDDCGCPEGDSDALISDNGYKSKNTVKHYDTKVDVEIQLNEAKTKVGVDLETESGNNKLNKNTGGSNYTASGNLSAMLSIFNQINRNFRY